MTEPYWARQVKDLSIAVEALSRVPGYDVESLSSRIRKIIDQLLTNVEEPLREPTPRQKEIDDEIPF